jgi:hypothetical protein
VKERKPKGKLVRANFVYSDTPTAFFSVMGRFGLAFDTAPASRGKMLGIAVADDTVADAIGKQFHDLAKAIRERKPQGGAHE